MLRHLRGSLKKKRVEIFTSMCWKNYFIMAWYAVADVKFVLSTQQSLSSLGHQPLLALIYFVLLLAADIFGGLLSILIYCSLLEI